MVRLQPLFKTLNRIGLLKLRNVRVDQILIKPDDILQEDSTLFYLSKTIIMSNQTVEVLKTLIICTALVLCVVFGCE